MYGIEQRGDIDDPLLLLADFPEPVIAQATKILSWLEAIDWRWDINTILAQPSDLLDAVFTLKSIGESIRAQAKKDK